MAQGDLSTLTAVKLWIGVTGTTSDVLLGRLVTAASGFVRGYLSRPYLGSTLITERYNGTGSDTLLLRHGPVTSIVSILYDGKTVTAAATGNPPSGGYLLDPAFETIGVVNLTDDVFSRDRLNVQVTYWAGYLAAAEAHTAAASVQAALTWLTDAGVTYANGTALAAVLGVPTVGQYAVSAGVYAFAAADVGKAVLISYGTVPVELEDAVIEIVGEAYKRLDRIGITTKTLAGQEIVSFSGLAIGTKIALGLSRFKRVAPI